MIVNPHFNGPRISVTTDWPTDGRPLHPWLTPPPRPLTVLAAQAVPVCHCLTSYLQRCPGTRHLPGRLQCWLSMPSPSRTTSPSTCSAGCPCPPQLRPLPQLLAVPVATTPPTGSHHLPLAGLTASAACPHCFLSCFQATHTSTFCVLLLATALVCFYYLYDNSVLGYSKQSAITYTTTPQPMSVITRVFLHFCISFYLRKSQISLQSAKYFWSTVSVGRNMAEMCSHQASTHCNEMNDQVRHPFKNTFMINIDQLTFLVSCVT